MASEPVTGPSKKHFQLRKPLFNKPSWAAPRPIAKDEDIFSRSRTSYAAVAEEEEKRRKRKAAKAAKREEEKKEKQRKEGHSNKKRRITIVDSDESASQDSNSRSGSEDSQLRRQPTSRSLTSSREKVTPRSRRAGRPHTATKSSPSERRSTSIQAEIFETDGDEDDKQNELPISSVSKKSALKSSFDNDAEPADLAPIFRKAKTGSWQLREDTEDDLQITAVAPKPSKYSADDDSPTDDELVELARQARERQGKVPPGLEEEPLKSQTPVEHTQESSLALETSFAAAESLPSQPQPQSQVQDPIIELLVTSPLPGTEHVIVKRRLHERLRDVRLAWCRQQEYSEAEAAGIILTYRRTRVFDFNNCKSLGAEVDEEGRVLIRGENNVLADSERKIHLEAMSEVMYAKHEQEVQRQRQRAQNPPEDEDEAIPESPAPKERKTRIILKAKDLPDFKLLVKDVSYFHLSEVRFE